MSAGMATGLEPQRGGRAAAVARASRLHKFYSHRSSRVTLAVTSILLCYGGGAAMFWLHAMYRGEKGPPIAAPYHWLLDSTLGFIALAPALFYLVPAARQRLKFRGCRVQALAVGSVFALITTPGPLIHDLAVGQGTPLAHLATSVFGRDAGVVARNVHAIRHSGVNECLLQLVVGLPVYVVLTQAAYALSGVLARQKRSGGAQPSRHAPQYLGGAVAPAADTAEAA